MSGSAMTTTDPYTPTDCLNKYVLLNATQVPAGTKDISWDIPSELSTEHAIIHVQWTDQSLIKDAG